jgi:hypothetical protein
LVISNQEKLSLENFDTINLATKGNVEFSKPDRKKSGNDDINYDFQENKHHNKLIKEKTVSSTKEIMQKISEKEMKEFNEKEKFHKSSSHSIEKSLDSINYNANVDIIEENIY